MVFCCIFPVNVVYSTVIQLCITSCQGRFDILTLSGSYVRTEIGGRTGGLSVCLASTDVHMGSYSILRFGDYHVLAFPFTVLSDYGNDIFGNGAYVSPCSFTSVLFGLGLLDLEVVPDLTAPGYKTFHWGLWGRFWSSHLGICGRVGR